MKTKTLIFCLGISIIIISGFNKQQQNSAESKKYLAKDVNNIKLHPALEKALVEYSNKRNDKGFGLADSTTAIGYIEVPEEFRKCMEFSTAPKNIRDLKYGLSLDVFKFEKSSEAKLGFLGFGNVEIADKETIIVLEFKQAGTQQCNNFQLFYGIGARMLMRIKGIKKGAKLDTPQQISASVTFGKAYVTFSTKTFGITGPGVARLVKTGTMTEDTYTAFLNEISNLIVEAYSDSSKYIITPEPLFLKQE